MTSGVSSVEGDSVTHLSSLLDTLKPIWFPVHLLSLSKHQPLLSVSCVSYALSPTQRRPFSHSASEVFFGKDGEKKIGGRYQKVIYREYTDATFTTLKPAPPYLGLLGEDSVLVVHWVFITHISFLNFLFLCFFHLSRSSPEGRRRRYS